MTIENHYQEFLEKNPYPRKLKNYNFNNLINFSSSDYLGLAKHPELIARSHEFAKRWGVGGTSSRLVTGNFDLYQPLEEKLARALNKPAALIIGAGYQANTTVLEALLDEKILGQKPLVFADKLSHVSLLATTQHYADLYRFKHNDLTHLKLLLEKYTDSSRPKFILVESIYSMDGDQADLPQLIKIAKQHKVLLYVDDAHAVGVYGKQGFGLAAEYADQIDIIMGTFSKGLGSYGAYIGCSETMRNYLINKCRGVIYSTGTSPAILGAMDAALDIVPQLQDERAQLLKRAQNLREFFKSKNLDYGNSHSHIVPWIIGDAEKTLQSAQHLEALGILATAIRPPSVSPGKSRIRFCLSMKHTDYDIEKLQDALLKTRLEISLFET